MLNLDIESADSLGGYGHNSFTYVIRSTDRERTIVAAPDIGGPLSGTVLDAATKQPIPGVKVAARVSCPPYWRAEARACCNYTDCAGRFKLDAVDRDWGVVAFHPDYADGFASPVRDDKELPEDIVIELGKAETAKIRGFVRDDEAKPLAGVVISHRNTTASTAEDGRFTLDVPRIGTSWPRSSFRSRDTPTKHGTRGFLSRRTCPSR